MSDASGTDTGLVTVPREADIRAGRPGTREPGVPGDKEVV